MFEERFSLFFVLRGGCKRHSEAKDVSRIFVRRLWKYCVFSEADRDIAHFVDRFRPYASKVFDAREHNVHQLVEERLLALTSEGHLVPHDVTLPELKRCDRFFSTSLGWSLTCDTREPVDDELALLLVVFCSHASRDYDLHEPWCLHRTCIAEIPLEGAECRVRWCGCVHPGSTF